MTKQTTLTEKINYCAGLVERSILQEELKGILLYNLEKLTEAELDSLAESLEREQMELGDLEQKLRTLEVGNDAAWQQAATAQGDAAQEMTDEFIADEIREQLKKKTE